MSAACTSSLPRTAPSCGDSSTPTRGAKLIAVGVYPDTGLKLARDKRDDARKLLAAGSDPSAVRKAEKVAQSVSVEALTREYLEKQSTKVSAGTLRRDRRRMEKYVYPALARRPIAAVTAPELLTALRRVEAKGFNETAHRTLEAYGRIERFAIASGRLERGITGDLKGALAPAVVTSHPAPTEPKAVGALMRAIEGYTGQPSVIYALRLLPHLADSTRRTAHTPSGPSSISTPSQQFGASQVRG